MEKCYVAYWAGDDRTFVSRNKDKVIKLMQDYLAIDSKTKLTVESFATFDEHIHYSNEHGLAHNQKIEQWVVIIPTEVDYRETFLVIESEIE